MEIFKPRELIRYPLSVARYMLWLVTEQPMDYQGTTTPANITIMEGEPTEPPDLAA